MPLPAYSEAVRVMLDRATLTGLARLEKMLIDPKATNRDILDAMKLILARTAPEPKVDSASSARNTINVIGGSSTFEVMQRAQARLSNQPVPTLEPEDADPDPVPDEDEQNS